MGLYLAGLGKPHELHGPHGLDRARSINWTGDRFLVSPSNKKEDVGHYVIKKHKIGTGDDKVAAM